MLLEFSLEKELCVSWTWFNREEKRKVTFRMGEDEREIDFVLIKKEHGQLILSSSFGVHPLRMTPTSSSPFNVSFSVAEEANA